MKTRWSTGLAALGLTLMALSSGRAAHAASVTGGGTVVISGQSVVWFSVSARRDAGRTEGTLRIRDPYAEFICDVTDLSFSFANGRSVVTGRGVVTHTTGGPYRVGMTTPFFFEDNEATGDRVALDGWGMPPSRPINGSIKIRP
jgi:hypothetical protein